MKKSKSKGRGIRAEDYVKIVEWSDEDDCFIGSAPPLIGRCCHGPDEIAVYKELCQIVEEWIEIHEADGTVPPDPTANREFSGKFVLRVSPELHRLLVLRAELDHLSLNAYVEKILSKPVAAA